jgi:AcrR family transcriptional regulator
MAQRPKVEVRASILQAAGEAFAEAGFDRAALSDIVGRGGTSIGNLYKYFANKDELFAAFLPREFTADLKQRLRAQVEALRAEANAFSLDAEHPYRRASEDLLRFTIANRDRVVFLLLRAKGTRHERFVGEVTRLLVELAQEHAQATYPGFAATPATKRGMTRIYRAFIATLGTILVEERSEHAVRQAVALQTAYHLSGLKALFTRAQPKTAAGGLSRWR